MSASEAANDASPGSSSAAVDWRALPIPLPEPGLTAAFELAGLELLLCNARGTPYVVRNECPHIRTALTGGTLRGTVLECPLHGGKFDVSDGRPVALPVRKPATCYVLRRAPNDAAVWQVGIPRQAP